MTINSRILSIAGGLLMALTAAQPSIAQKRGGILKMYTPDSPASMSVLEESTVFSRCRLLARAFSEMQAAACPGGVERGPLRGTGDFPGKLGGFPRRGRSLWCEAQAEISRK